MYNSALFVERCLHSCINQDLLDDDYEIIVIDDGSSDDSSAIASNVLKEHKNARIVRQENKGLSVSRNVGLEIARGDYIWFVDSDDAIEENCLKYIKDKCISSFCDIFSFCASEINNGQEHRIFSRKEGKICEGKKYICAAMSVCVPFSIYQKKFLAKNMLTFVPGIFHEDAEFTPRAYYYAKRVVSSNKILYKMFLRPDSITGTPNLQRSQDIFNVVLRNLDRLYTMVDSETQPELASLIATDFNYALRQGIWADNESLQRLNTLACNNKKLLIYFFHSKLFKHKLCYITYSLFPQKMATLYKLAKCTTLFV